jgi:ABC-type nitrate/sulfonate/bicarbonate transport system substrate-binding protein
MNSRRHFLATSAALAVAPPAAFAQSATKITVGTSPIDGAMGVVAAERAGFFQKQMLDVTLAVANGAANAAAVAGGSLQFAASNIVTLIKAHLRGLPFAIVAPGAVYSSDNPTQVLVVRKDAPFKSAADLDGKTIGTTSIGDVLASSTLAWIDQHGGSSATVKLVEIPPSAVDVALASGRIDAATLAEPHLSEAVASGEAVVFAKIFDAIAPRFIESGYFALRDYVDANRDTTVRFSRAILDGNVFANRYPDRTAPWLVDSAKVDLASVKRSRREVFATTMDPALVQVVIDALVRMKQIDRGFNATEMISPLVL